jgi:hypothetical protein
VHLDPSKKLIKIKITKQAKVHKVEHILKQVEHENKRIASDKYQEPLKRESKKNRKYQF